MARETINLCLRLLKKISKSNFGSYSISVRNSVLVISYFTFRDCRMHIFSDKSSIQIIECTFILNGAGKKTETQHVHLVPVLL